MIRRKVVSLELARQKLAEMAPSNARDAFELLTEHASQLDGWECGAAQKGYFIDFRYYTPTEHPFAFIINKGSLRWYFRAPAGLRSDAASVERLRRRFDDVEERPNGEVAVQLRSLDDAETILQLAFGRPPFGTPDGPRIYTQAQLLRVAQRLAGTFAFGTDDAPLYVAQELGRYAPGEAVALGAAMTLLLPEGRSRDRFHEFLLDVAHGKIHSVFGCDRGPPRDPQESLTSTDLPELLLQEVLRPAYAPCASFQNVCTSMRWDPAAGHVPRGYCGAPRSLRDVRLVLVTAEPGDPHPQEAHAVGSNADATIRSVYLHARRCYSDGKDLFHRNIRLILDLCWPELNFEEQLARTWLTDSVLCSARVEGGHVPARVARECGSRYLAAQLALFPHAIVAAFGTKAQSRLRAIGYHTFFAAGSVAPPGCHRSGVRLSWERLAAEVRRRGSAS